MRTKGEGNQNLAKFCGRLLWMAPKCNILRAFLAHLYLEASSSRPGQLKYSQTSVIRGTRLSAVFEAKS